VSPLAPISVQDISRRAALQLIAGGVGALAAGRSEPDEKIVEQETGQGAALCPLA
jgi:hypothetical protein